MACGIHVLDSVSLIDTDYLKAITKQAWPIRIGDVPHYLCLLASHVQDFLAPLIQGLRSMAITEYR